MVHIISGVGTGGAENFLLRLISSLAEHNVTCRVISLSAGGDMVRQFRQAGFELKELGLQGAGQWWRLAGVVRCLRHQVRAWRPDIIQGWMNHGNVAAWIARATARPSSRLIWSIRQAVYDPALDKKGTRAVARLQSWLSPSADAVVCNSELGLRQYQQAGYRSSNMLFIPNGFDTEKFRPRPEMRAAARTLVKAGEHDFAVGMIARYHPIKDYRTFLEAVAIAAREVPNLRAVCIGKGVQVEQGGLAQLVRHFRLDKVCTLLEERTDLEYVYPGLDVACLTSLAEAFPNVIGEAMACGVPCVATNVGDVASLIGDTGRVVPPQRPREFAAALVEFSRMEADARARISALARERIISEYSMRVIGERYLDLYDAILRTSRRGDRL